MTPLSPKFVEVKKANSLITLTPHLFESRVYCSLLSSTLIKKTWIYDWLTTIIQQFAFHLIHILSKNIWYLTELQVNI